MELRAYNRSDGFFDDPSVLEDRPLLPGTLVIDVPVVSTIQLRFGIVVAADSANVNVLWNPWTDDPNIVDGSLRKQLGIPNARERRKRRRL